MFYHIIMPFYKEDAYRISYDAHAVQVYCNMLPVKLHFFGQGPNSYKGREGFKTIVVHGDPFGSTKQ